MKVSFWLLDINPKIDGDKGTLELWLWGIDFAGNRVLVIDRNFIAYFYAVVADGSDASKVAEGNHERLWQINCDCGGCPATFLRQTRTGNKGLLQGGNRNWKSCKATSKRRRSKRLPRRRHSRLYAVPNRQQHWLPADGMR